MIDSALVKGLVLGLLVGLVMTPVQVLSIFLGLGLISFCSLPWVIKPAGITPK